MTLKQIKLHLEKLQNIVFVLPDGTLVPEHFHVTEIGKTTKTFIDCGGKLRQEKKVIFQLWNTTDFNHRLLPMKLIKIIDLAEKTLSINNLEVIVEFQGRHTIEVFDLDFKDHQFYLKEKSTNCLALDQCGISSKKPKTKLSDLTTNSCNSNSDCC